MQTAETVLNVIRNRRKKRWSYVTGATPKYMLDDTSAAKLRIE